LVCDCDLRWYRQWIEEEWNEVEEEWLKDTYCTDPADRLEHNIAEVPLKDMFCDDDVTDKPGKVKIRLTHAKFLIRMNALRGMNFWQVSDGGRGFAVAPSYILTLTVLAFNRKMTF